MSTEAAETETESLEVRAIAVERLTFFADAVIAIAITLLALDLPLPDGSTNAELLHSIGANREEFIAFFISFIVIGARWSAHHRVFRHVTAITGRLSQLTMYWLLMQVITPFVTRVLTGDGAFQARFIIYASVQVIAGALFLAMLRTLARANVLRPDSPPGLLARNALRTVMLSGAFLISIPVSFLSEPAAYACWIVVPILIAIIGRLRARRTPH